MVSKSRKNAIPNKKVHFKDDVRFAAKQDMPVRSVRTKEQSKDYTSYQPLKKWHPSVYRVPRASDVSFGQIIDASVIKRTGAGYARKAILFEDWLDKYATNGGWVPKYDDLRQHKDLIWWINIVGTYLTDRFNDTHNIGNTLAAHLDALLHHWGLKYNLFLKRKDFAFLNKFVRGCNALAQDKYGKRVNVPKYAIVNRQLKAILGATRCKDLKIAFLLQQRFVLRAEHYTYTHPNKKPVVIGDVRFYPGIANPAQATVITRFDKNHRTFSYCERTCMCTCNIEWKCVVHALADHILPRLHVPWEPLIMHNNRLIRYDYVLSGLKAVVRGLGLDPTHYGTHSFRAGGATELHCEGRDPFAIQRFGHWKSLDSALGYIRPWNADLHLYVKNWDLYCQERRQQNPYGNPSLNVMIMPKGYKKSTC